MGKYLDLAQKAVENMEGAPERAAELAPWEREEVARLRSRLAELRQRIDKGFEVLRAREDAGKTGKPYPLWLETWEKLLREYEQTADRLAEITRCPIGDCAQFDTCATRPAPCPAVEETHS